MERAPFYLYLRQRKGKEPVWYVKYRDAEGKVLSPVCTDETDKEKATRWAVRNAVKLATADRERQRNPRGQTFKEWAADWWLSSCPYIAERRADGFHLSGTYASIRRSYLTRHLLPEFGKYRLSELRPAMFRDFKMRMKEAGTPAPATINQILGTMRIMLGYAVKMGELETSPISPVGELKEEPRQRGILTPSELAELFGPGALERVWRGELRHYAANMLSASTGMRLGEVQAVMVKAIDPRGFLDVAYSWDDLHGLGQPKWNSRRFVPVTTRTAKAINELLAFKKWGEPQPDDFIFWGRDRHTPIAKDTMLYNYKKALAAIGITEEKRAERNLVFHSWRHGFSTMMRGRVPDEQLRRITGHRTAAMSDTYDHAGPEHLADVKAAQESLFSPQSEHLPES